MLDIPNLSSSTGRSSSARLLGRQSRRNLEFVAAASSLALCFLGGMSAPAVAFHHWHNRPYASVDGGSESRGSHRHRGSAETAESGRPGKPGKPEPAKQPSGPLILAISIGNQRVTVYDNGTPVAVSAVSTGVPGHPTPLGVFSVIQKQRWHHSNLYSNAPMPYMQRITWSGVALHAGVVPGHPASHGCIRLPERFAVRLWGMTKVGARVIVTRGNAAPYEINHPRLAGLVATSEGAVDDVGAVNGRSSAAKPSAVVVAATGTATADVPGTEVAHDDAEHSGSGSGADASASPQGGTGDSQDKPAETGQTAEPSTVEPSPAQKIDAALQHPGPLSLFVSRKLGKLFVRKGFTPVFDTPVTIAHPEVPLGTHVFTAIRPTNGGAGVRWLAVSIGDRPAARPAPTKHKGRAARDERAAPDALHQAAAEALDRIELPPEALEHIVPLVTPGASLLISDQGLGNETGRDTDFIVVTR